MHIYPCVRVCICMHVHAQVSYLQTLSFVYSIVSIYVYLRISQYSIVSIYGSLSIQLCLFTDLSVFNCVYLRLFTDLSDEYTCIHKHIYTYAQLPMLVHADTKIHAYSTSQPIHDFEIMHMCTYHAHVYIPCTCVHTMHMCTYHAQPTTFPLSNTSICISQL